MSSLDPLYEVHITHAIIFNLKMELRLIESGECDPALNMAIDEAITNSGIPTLRLFSWDAPAVTMGYFQKANEVAKLDLCKNDGVSVIRRISAGGTVFHGKGSFTYSLCVPQGELGMENDVVCKWLCDAIITTLAKIGVKGEFKPPNDVLIDGKKVSGNAQATKNGSFLQHGTIIVSDCITDAVKYLNIPKGKKPITSVCSELGRKVETEELNRFMIEAFKEDSHVRVLKPAKLSEEELAYAKELCEKYSSDEWNLSK